MVTLIVQVTFWFSSFLLLPFCVFYFPWSLGPATMVYSSSHNILPSKPLGLKNSFPVLLSFSVLRTLSLSFTHSFLQKITFAIVMTWLGQMDFQTFTKNLATSKWSLDFSARSCPTCPWSLVAASWHLWKPSNYQGIAFIWILSS